jgi:hypothetical protein
MFNKYMQPYLENDDGTNPGGSEGVTDAQPADVQTDTDTGASDANNGSDGAAAHQQSADENAKYAAARRDAEAREKQLKERQDNFAKQFGYNTFEEMEYANQVQQYAQQNNVDPAIAEMKIKQDRLENMLAMQGHQTRIQQEKASLQSQRFFKDLEPEIDATLRVNPSLSVRDVFNYIKGQKMDELFTKEIAAAKQRQLNNINGKSHIRPDGGGADNDFTDIDPEEFKVAKALNPKETLESYRAWKKSQK